MQPTNSGAMSPNNANQQANVGNDANADNSLILETIKNSQGFVTKNDVDSTITKQVLKAVGWVIAALAFTIFGYIISNLWIMNGELKEIKGKYSSPDNIINHISSRMENLEKINQLLNDSLQKQQLLRLQNEINQLKKKKGEK
jgi:hypothetical protein